MSDEAPATEKSKKDRSPSFPFISLRKAVDRAEALNANHRREPARLASVAASWGYAPKSSGLLQTVAALKQFGLAEDLGSGDDRKVQLTDLARRLLVDSRPGARETAIREAARSPRLIAEYLGRWLPDRPSDDHCISELHLDRGFTREAAKLFLRVFDETVSYADLNEGDTLSANVPETPADEKSAMTEQPAPSPQRQGIPDVFSLLYNDAFRSRAKPLMERLQVTTTGNQISINAILISSSEVDKLIRILEANKLLLDEKIEEA